MFCEEKLNELKKEFPATDFKDPFYEGPAIIEKIIQKLFEKRITGDLDLFERIKDKTLIKKCTVTQLFGEVIPALGTSSNYWLLLLSKYGVPNRVYDCKSVAISKIAGMLYPLSFSVADKKYNWAICFKGENNEVESIVPLCIKASAD